MNIERLNQSATQVSELMKMLSSVNRLLILCQLTDGEKSVGELCKLVSMKPPAMSQQLSILRREGLLKSNRVGQSIFYSITDDNLLKLISFLHDTYCSEP
ncbi:ArsR/SmtB family transcription factor [Arenicella xantha]|uniref:ArsR family transcriptional regulator n=1 Tax=Arenicella xantha TaxID=644221 RepID=A0A395JJJ9_9GAMM|nr:metalloregulator ArsR/SmtB family transcription factor [Arenicella xantha]RBP50689.1 ArsR family transcriptional regulator [Arenicella xantha]